MSFIYILLYVKSYKSFQVLLSYYYPLYDYINELLYNKNKK